MRSLNRHLARGCLSVLLLASIGICWRPFVGRASNISSPTGGVGLMGGTFGASSVSASSTTFFNWGGTVTFTSEFARNWYVAQPGTVRNFYVTTGTAQPGTGSLVITLRKNGVDQTVAITIAAGAAAGNFSDTSNSFTVAAGDILVIKLVNSATAGSALLLAWGVGFTAP